MCVGPQLIAVDPHGDLGLAAVGRDPREGDEGGVADQDLERRLAFQEVGLYMWGGTTGDVEMSIVGLTGAVASLIIDRSRWSQSRTWMPCLDSPRGISGLGPYTC